MTMTKDYLTTEPIEIRKYWNGENNIARTRSGTVTFTRTPVLMITAELVFNFPIEKQDEVDSILANWLLDNKKVTELTYGYISATKKFILHVKIPTTDKHLDLLALTTSIRFALAEIDPICPYCITDPDACCHDINGCSLFKEGLKCHTY